MDGRTNVKRDDQVEKMDGRTTNRQIHQPERGLSNLEGDSMTWWGTQLPGGECSDVGDSDQFLTSNHLVARVIL